MGATKPTDCKHGRIYLDAHPRSHTGVPTWYGTRGTRGNIPVQHFII